VPTLPSSTVPVLVSGTPRVADAGLNWQSFIGYIERIVEVGLIEIRLRGVGKSKPRRDIRITEKG